MTDLVFSTPDAVEAALHSPTFAPPAPPTTTVGPAAELRSEMARFSHGADHGPRRAAVEAAVAAINGFDFEAEAQRRTERRLDDFGTPDGTPALGVNDVLAGIGFTVPTETMATALGLPDQALPAVRQAVLAVVETIGRQQPTTPATDRAVEHLRTLFADHPNGPVAPISLLYQTHDATAALLASTVEAEHSGRARRSALARTVRVATAKTRIGTVEVAAGEAVALDLDTSGHEFGTGPHHCPGRSQAEAIVKGILGALKAGGYVLQSDLVEHHPDGRPRTLPMRRH